MFLLQNAFGSLGTPLGLAWVLLGLPRDFLESQRGSKEGVLGGLVAPLGSLGTHLGSFSDRLEVILGSFGDLFGISWGSSGSHFFDFSEFASRAQTPIIRTPWGWKPMLKLNFSITGADFEGFRRVFFFPDSSHSPSHRVWGLALES